MQAGNQPRHTGHSAEQTAGFRNGQHHGYSRGASSPDHPADIAQRSVKHMPIQKHQGIQSLILSSGSNTSIDGQKSKESAHLGFGHIRGMALAVKQNEPANPVNVRLFSRETHVPQPDNTAHRINEWRRSATIGHRCPLFCPLCLLSIENISRTSMFLFTFSNHQVRRRMTARAARGIKVH